MQTRPPLPPFTSDSALQKVRLAEDGWNSRDAAKVVTAYTLDTEWRNRVTFVTNRKEAEAFLKAKMDTRTRLPPDQRTLGLYRRPHRRPLCL